MYTHIFVPRHLQQQQNIYIAKYEVYLKQALKLYVLHNPIWVALSGVRTHILHADRTSSHTYERSNHKSHIPNPINDRSNGQCVLVELEAESETLRSRYDL